MQIHLRLDQGIHAHTGNRPEHENQNTAHDRRGNTLQQQAELADKRQQNGKNSSPGHDHRIEYPGEHHRAGDFRIGGIGRAAKQGRHHARHAIASEGAVQAGFANVVLARDITDGQHITHMLNGRGQRHRHHEQDRGPVKRGRNKGRH